MQTTAALLLKSLHHYCRIYCSVASENTALEVAEITALQTSVNMRFTSLPRSAVVPGGTSVGRIPDRCRASGSLLPLPPCVVSSRHQPTGRAVTLRQQSWKGGKAAGGSGEGRFPRIKRTGPPGATAAPPAYQRRKAFQSI